MSIPLSHTHVRASPAWELPEVNEHDPAMTAPGTPHGIHQHRATLRAVWLCHRFQKVIHGGRLPSAQSLPAELSTSPASSAAPLVAWNSGPQYRL